MVKALTLTLIFLISLTIINKSYSFEVGVATKYQKPMKLILGDQEENLFIEPNIFYNYKNSNSFDHNLGLKVNFGYEVNDFEFFTIAGYHRLFFDSDSNNNKNGYKDNQAPLYGIGIGYELNDRNISLRVSNTYSNLKRRVDNKSDKVLMTNIGIVFLF